MTLVIKDRRERKKAAARARIVAEAIKLFSRDGIEGATVEQIAEAADVGKGTVYNHFAAKEDIVVAFMADLEGKVQKKAARLSQSDEPLRVILAKFVNAQLRMKRPYHRFVRVFFGQMFGRTEQFFPYMAEMQKSIDPPLEALFGGLRTRGVIRPEPPLPDLILIFKTVQMGLSGLWAIEGPPFRATERAVELEMKIFCEGLEAK
jgi:AcrR family transcriptional regulator